jgi:hypothetical protein
MTLDIELPIKKSTYEEICKLVKILPIILAFFIMISLLVLLITIVGQFIYYIIDIPITSSTIFPPLFPLNIGGAIGTMIGITLVIFSTGLVKFHCKETNGSKK